MKPKPPKHNHAGLRDYSLETLLFLKRDLMRNPLSSKAGSWECERLDATIKEIERRMK